MRSPSACRDSRRVLRGGRWVQPESPPGETAQTRIGPADGTVGRVTVKVLPWEGIGV
jgi:hypothetical protein